MIKSDVVYGVLQNVAARAVRNAGFILMAALFVLLCAASAHAQTQPLPLGTITNIVNNINCTVNNSNPLSQATCYALTVDCSNVDPNLLPLVGTIAVSTPASPKGTIFIQGGGSGNVYFNEGSGGSSYAASYYTDGYQVVQIAWASEWQGNYATGTALEPLLYAACRPATVLEHVNAHFHTTGGMCAQGHSAGSAAMAYSLAMYDSYSYLDNVVLTSGPVYSNVQEGCQDPNVVTSVTICPPTLNNGCDTQDSWTDFPQYVNTVLTGDTVSAAQAVAGYTIPGSNCNNWMPSLGDTTNAQNMEWNRMSITNALAVYDYPDTTIRAFLCGPPTGDNPQNNSAAQGWLFYQNVIAPGVPPNFLVHRIDNCTGDEMIWGIGSTDNGEGGASGFTVSVDDMETYCVNNHLHHN
jgi:hypothetical protein